MSIQRTGQAAALTCLATSVFREFVLDRRHVLEPLYPRRSAPTAYSARRDVVAGTLGDVAPSRLSRGLALAAIAATLPASAHAMVMAPTHAAGDEMQMSAGSAICVALAVIAGVGLLRVGRRALGGPALLRFTEPLAVAAGVGPFRVPPDRPPRASPAWLQRFLR